MHAKFGEFSPKGYKVLAVTFVIYVYLCFVGNVAVSVWLVSVWLIISCDYSDWMTAITMNADRHYGLYGPYLYDYYLYYHTSACDCWLLPPISVNVWQYQCMSGNQSMYVSMYYIQSTTYKLFITQIILIVFFNVYIYLFKCTFT